MASHGVTRHARYERLLRKHRLDTQAEHHAHNSVLDDDETDVPESPEQNVIRSESLHGEWTSSLQKRQQVESPSTTVALTVTEGQTISTPETSTTTTQSSVTPTTTSTTTTTTETPSATSPDTTTNQSTTSTTETSTSIPVSTAKPISPSTSTSTINSPSTTSTTTTTATSTTSIQSIVSYSVSGVDVPTAVISVQTHSPSPATSTLDLIAGIISGQSSISSLSTTATTPTTTTTTTTSTTSTTSTSTSTTTSTTTTTTTTTASQTSTSATSYYSDNPSSNPGDSGSGTGGGSWSVSGSGGGGFNTNSASTPSTTSSSSSSGLLDPETTGKIVGGVVGGVAGATVIFLLIFLLFRRRKKGFLFEAPGGLAAAAAAAGGDGAGTAAIEGSTRQMVSRDSNREPMFRASYFAPAFMKRWRYSQRSTGEESIISSEPSERGFQKISGRKLPSGVQPALEYSSGGLEEGSPTGSEPSPTLPVIPRSPISQPPPSIPFGMPLDASYTREAAAEHDVVVFRPSPARTPVTGSANPTMWNESHLSRTISMSFPMPPSSPPAGAAIPKRPDALGRSHPSYDGSRGSRFTESL